jgi:hypothetical protein
MRSGESLARCRNSFPAPEHFFRRRDAFPLPAPERIPSREGRARGGARKEGGAGGAGGEPRARRSARRVPRERATMHRCRTYPVGEGAEGVAIRRAPWRARGGGARAASGVKHRCGVIPRQPDGGATAACTLTPRRAVRRRGRIRPRQSPHAGDTTPPRARIPTGGPRQHASAHGAAHAVRGRGRGRPCIVRVRSHHGWRKNSRPSPKQARMPVGERW